MLEAVLACSAEGISAGADAGAGAGRRAADQVIVAVRLKTSMAPGAETRVGALISFEVHGAWMPDDLLCGGVSPAQVVEHSWSLLAWPSRLRLRAPRFLPPFTDPWGLQRFDVAEVGGRSFSLLADCGDDCEYTTANLARWVSSDSEYNEFEVPALDSPDWLAEAWGPCCCPSGDAFGAECTPGQRTRNVTCSSGDIAGCTNSLPVPIQVAPCQDYTSCSYQPFCPLGGGRKLDCSYQGWGLLGIILVLVVLGSLTCRYCQRRWFWCHPACQPWKMFSCIKGPEVQPEPVLAQNNEDDKFAVLPETRVQVHSEMPLSQTPEDVGRLLGSWCYDNTRKYSISRLYENKFRFDEQLPSGQWAYGTFEPEGGWLQGKILIRHTTKECGTMRLRYMCGEDKVLSNFKTCDDTWGPDMYAQRAGTLPQPQGFRCGADAELVPTSEIELAYGSGALDSKEPGVPHVFGSTKLSGGWDVSDGTKPALSPTRTVAEPPSYGILHGCVQDGLLTL